MPRIPLNGGKDLASQMQRAPARARMSSQRHSPPRSAIGGSATV
jgi:hypothetical protein